MTHRTRNWMLTIATLAFALLTGCASTTSTIDSSKALAKASDGSDSIVFGKFTLVRNGAEAKLNDGLFAGTTAFLHVEGDDGARQIVGQVGKNGEFAWALAPGNYRVSEIDFYHRGERQEIEAGLDFTVPEDGQPVYVGTITLEASINMGYYRPTGTVDSFIVQNDCESDCARRLDALGMSAETPHVVMPQSAYQLARTD